MVQGLNSQQRDHLGTGWSFPLRTSVQGGIQLSTGEQDIEEAIRIILRTEIGERVYRPTFGCRLSELAFTPLNTRTLLLIKLYVEEALRIWEPRIELEEITPDPDPILGRVNIQINYRVKDTYAPGSIIFPFYLMTPQERAERYG